MKVRFGSRQTRGFGTEELQDVARPEYPKRYFAPRRNSLRANDYERAVLARRFASPARPPG